MLEFEFSLLIITMGITTYFISWFHWIFNWNLYNSLLFLFNLLFLNLNKFWRVSFICFIFKISCCLRLLFFLGWNSISIQSWTHLRLYHFTIFNAWILFLLLLFHFILLLFMSLNINFSLCYFLWLLLNLISLHWIFIFFLIFWIIFCLIIYSLHFKTVELFLNLLILFQFVVIFLFIRICTVLLLLLLTSHLIKSLVWCSLLRRLQASGLVHIIIYFRR